jgi:hypothetical protein
LLIFFLPTVPPFLPASCNRPLCFFFLLLCLFISFSWAARGRRRPRLQEGEEDHLRSRTPAMDESPRPPLFFAPCSRVLRRFQTCLLLLYRDCVYPPPLPTLLFSSSFFLPRTSAFFFCRSLLSRFLFFFFTLFWLHTIAYIWSDLNLSFLRVLLRFRSQQFFSKCMRLRYFGNIICCNSNFNWVFVHFSPLIKIQAQQKPPFDCVRAFFFFRGRSIGEIFILPLDLVAI